MEVKNCIINDGTAPGPGVGDDWRAGISVDGDYAHLHHNTISVQGYSGRGIVTSRQSELNIINDNTITGNADQIRSLWIVRSAEVFNNTISVTGCNGIVDLGTEYGQYYPESVFNIYDNTFNPTKVGCPSGGSRSWGVSIPINADFYNNIVNGIDLDEYPNGGTLSTVNVGSNSKIHDNEINIDGWNARGIYFEENPPTENVEIYGNTVLSYDTHADDSDGSPLRVRSGLNISIHDNVFKSVYNTKTAMVFGASPAMRVTGEIYNNTFSGRIGIFFYDQTIEGPDIHHNTIYSTYHKIRVNYPYESIYFRSNTFLPCVSGCDPDGRTGYTYSNQGHDIYLVDSVFSSPPDFYINGDAFNVQWYLDVFVSNGTQGVNGAQVTITGPQGQAFIGTTGSNGRIPQQTLIEFRQSSSGRTNYSPYSITVTSGSFNETRSVTLNASKTETFYTTPCTTGQTQSCTTTQSCPGTQTCSSGVWGTCNDISGDNCPDIIAPSTITNLSVNSCTNNSCSLTWTSPGDDSGTGTATQYDLRYSTSTITSKTLVQQHKQQENQLL